MADVDNGAERGGRGGVALIATLIALIVTDLLSDGFSIDGVGTWIAATVIVWLGGLLAAFILPFLGLRKYLEDRPSSPKILVTVRGVGYKFVPEAALKST